MKSTGRKETLKKIKRRDEILSAAAELFSSKGFVATSIDDITQHLSISHGSVYYYYSSKEDILKAIIEDWIHASRTKVRSWRQRSEYSAYDRLNMVLKMLESFQAFRLKMDGPVDESKADPVIFETFISCYLENGVSDIAVIISDGNKEGIFNCTNPHATAIMIALCMADSLHRAAQIESVALWKDYRKSMYQNIFRIVGYRK